MRPCPRSARTRRTDAAPRPHWTRRRCCWRGTLADASANAQLVVVGARGRGGFLGLVRGSVATTLPAHARCPTIVVPGEDQEEPAPTSAPVVVGMDESQRSRVAALHAAQVAR